MRSHGVEVGRNAVTGRSKGQKMEGGCKWRGHVGSHRSLLETTEIIQIKGKNQFFYRP